MKFVSFFVLPFFLLACTAPAPKHTPYPVYAKASFLNGCPGKNKEFCSCTFDKIEKTVPFQTLFADLKKYGAQYIYERPYIDAGLSCSKFYPK